MQENYENTLSEFVSVKDYTLEYGHNGKHIKVIRTRFDNKEDKSSVIKFYLMNIDLIHSYISTSEITEQEVRDLFTFYCEDLPKRFVDEFIQGLM
jgi:RNA binding exosome subunit